MPRKSKKPLEICKIESMEKAIRKGAKSKLAGMLEAMLAADPQLTAEDIARSMAVLREYCLARAHAEITGDGELTKESWQAMTLSGMAQDQAQKDQLHAQKIKQFEAGLDGLIEVRFMDESEGK